MSRFDVRARLGGLSARGKILGIGVSIATLVGSSALATDGFAESPFAAKKYVAVCVQRTGSHESKGDLNVLHKHCAKGQKPLNLALYPVKTTRGPQGAQGPQGPAGPQGPQGPPGTTVSPAIPQPEYAVVSVFVDRGNGPSRFATYSAPLGSPAGTTTGGDFRFTCSPTQQPCKISYGAAVISNRSGNAAVYPRLVITKQAGDVPITSCEYADGADNNGGVAQIPRVPSLADAETATQTPLNMGIGGTLDCGPTQPPQPYTPVVTDIWVPAASAAAPAFYDVAATFTVQ